MPATSPNVAALVQQMPETDQDLQTKQTPAAPPTQDRTAPSPKTQPGRSHAASKFTGPDPAAAEKLFTEILAGGRDSILALLGLVREPSDPDYQDYKAAYVLHGLVLLAGRPGQEKQRRLLTETLASQLTADTHSQAVKGFFIRELRWLGSDEVVHALGQQLLDNALCGDAAQTLLTIRQGVASQFRAALPKAAKQNRVVLLHALGVLGDTDAAPALTQALTDEDRDVRRTAAWGLANMGAASAADALLKSADTAEGWERIQATDACLLLAERLAAAGQKPQAARIFSHLRDTRTDPADRHVRDAAQRGLNALPKTPPTSA